MAKHSVQEILSTHITALMNQRRFSLSEHKALRQLSQCRTAALGGHIQTCEKGHVNGVWYNSCRHRSCPQCQGFATERWLQKANGLMMDCPHHHIIFTLPAELHIWWRYNRKTMTSLLFKVVRETLKAFSDDPKYLCAQPGLLMALHTWGRSLNLHPHIHVLMSHGGLNQEGEWVEPKKKHLFPQKAVMLAFKGKFLSLLHEVRRDEGWQVPPDETVDENKRLLKAMRGKDWVVHFRDCYRHAKGVVKYLSRYVKRSPLKNAQIESVTDSSIRFKYKSHKTKQMERMTLTPQVFIERLLMHVPLFGRSTVRYCGLYAASNRQRLANAKNLLGQDEVVASHPLEWGEYLEKLGDRPVCSVCGANLRHKGVVEKQF